MREPDAFTDSLFTHNRIAVFISYNHMLLPIRAMVNAALIKMVAFFRNMVEDDIKGGRPNIAPGKIVYTMLLQVSIPCVKCTSS